MTAEYSMTFEPKLTEEASAEKLKLLKTSTDGKQRAVGGIQIGKFRGEKYIADGYDFDQDNAEIAKMFEVGKLWND